ncbi:MAG: hypothetical protein LBP59_16140 [Planctomycetaceae bacterium]|jgi:hypothetical protein|nr:hypothetical protein [Planctomycetaceae bacterium]
MSEVEISPAFFFAFRQSAGETPAILAFFVTINICPARDNMLVEKNDTIFLRPVRDAMTVKVVLTCCPYRDEKKIVTVHGYLADFF